MFNVVCFSSLQSLYYILWDTTWLLLTWVINDTADLLYHTGRALVVFHTYNIGILRTSLSTEFMFISG